MNYKEKLLDPRWQRKRLEILQRDNFSCQSCADDASTLHVHHMVYTSGDPWDIDNDFLITLCESCHRNEELGKIESERCVVRDLRKAGFLNDDMVELGRVFSENKFNVRFPPSISMLEYALKYMWSEIDEKYFQYLHDKSEKMSEDREGKKE